MLCSNNLRQLSTCPVVLNFIHDSDLVKVFSIVENTLTGSESFSYFISFPVFSWHRYGTTLEAWASLAGPTGQGSPSISLGDERLKKVAGEDWLKPPPSLKPHFLVWNRILYTQVYSYFWDWMTFEPSITFITVQLTIHHAHCAVTFWSLPRPGRYGMSTAQLELRWETQRGVVPVTATCTKDHAAPWRQNLWSLITRESFFWGV